MNHRALAVIGQGNGMLKFYNSWDAVAEYIRECQ